MAYTPVDPNVDLETYNEDLMIQAQMAAAINRHAIYTNITDGSVQFTHDGTRFFVYEPYNEYVRFFHDEEISFESQTYAFAYDDVGDHSSTIQCTFPTNVKVIIGGYGDNSTTLSSNDIQINNSPINISPNPTNGKDVLISNVYKSSIINVYTVQGQLVNSIENIEGDSIKINTSNLASGLYLINIKSSTSNIQKNTKLLIN